MTKLNYFTFGEVEYSPTVEDERALILNGAIDRSVKIKAYFFKALIKNGFTRKEALSILLNVNWKG